MWSYLTSIVVVLLQRRVACIARKHRRLRANAKFRTALRYNICKEHQKDENAELSRQWQPSV